MSPGTSSASKASRHPAPNSPKKRAAIRQYRVGKHVFTAGEEVFAQWEGDRNWYSGQITGVHQKTQVMVTWFEGGSVDTCHVDPDRIVLAKDIMVKDQVIYVVNPDKMHYDAVAFRKYLGMGGSHQYTNEVGAVVAKKLSVMQAMMHDNDVRHWKRGKTLANKTAHLTEANLSPYFKRCRSESSSPERRSPIPLRKVRPFVMPKKAKPDTDAMGSSAQPFSSYAFLITSGAGWDSTFDRANLVKIVLKLGGTVTGTFTELMDCGKTPVLIAPVSCKTEKYLSCLAADVPCVSHKWIFDVIESGGQEVPFEKYRLPAGRSLAGDRIIEWAPRTKLLYDLRIGLFGDTYFCQLWSRCLHAGRAETVVIREEEIGSIFATQLHAVIVDGVASADLVRSAVAKGVSLVSLEWLVETLIYGTVRPYRMWPYLHPTEEFPV